MNMNVDAIYSTALGKQHFQPGEEKTLTIDGGEIRKFDDGKAKITLRFREIPQPWIVNKTNAKAMVEMFGTSEATEWKGRRITLYVKPDVEFGGAMVGGVRVKIEPQAQPQATTGQSQQAGPQTYRF